MKTLETGYLNILTINDKYETFQNYDKRFLEGTLPDEEFNAYFWSLKSLETFYTKFIRFLYRKKGIYMQSPVEILTRAGKDKLITDADTWLNYTKWVNYCVGIKDAAQKKEAMIRVLEKFRYKIESMHILTESPENKKFLEENEIIFNEICKQELKLPDGPVNYNCEELLIKESSYNILLDYFKSLPQIKRVWLHGSRAQGTSNYGSDLDLLFDCELSAWEEVYSSFGKVLVPYFIDGKSIYVEEQEPFIKCAIHQGIKKIYDIKDFQFFWEDGKSFTDNSKIDISKLI